MPTLSPPPPIEEPRTQDDATKVELPVAVSTPSCLESFRGLPLAVVATSWHFIPGMIAMLLCEPVDDVRVVAMFLFASSFSLAGAAQGLGYLEGLTLWQGFRRGPNHAISIFLGTVCLFILCIPAVSVTGYVYEYLYEDVPVWVQEWIFIVLAALPSAWFVSRVWPAACNSFTCVESETGHYRKGGWYGPGLITAWQMTGLEGSFRSHTLPFFLASGLLWGSYSAFLSLASWLEWSPTSQRLVGYWFFFPIWCLIVVGVGGHLHRKWRESKSAGFATGNVDPTCSRR